MSTITKEFTKEQLQQIEAAAKEVMWPVVWSEKKAREHFSEKITPKVVLKLARIALASLEAEPVAYMYKDNLHSDARFSLHTRFGNWSQEDINEYEITEIPLYAAPPAPVSVHDELAGKSFNYIANKFQVSTSEAQWILVGWNARSVSMLQGAETSPETDNTAQQFEALATSEADRKLDERRRRNRQANARARAKETPEQANQRRAANRDRMRAARGGKQ